MFTTKEDPTYQILSSKLQRLRHASTRVKLSAQFQIPSSMWLMWGDFGYFYPTHANLKKIPNLKKKLHSKFQVTCWVWVIKEISGVFKSFHGSFKICSLNRHLRWSIDLHSKFQCSNSKWLIWENFLGFSVSFKKSLLSCWLCWMMHIHVKIKVTCSRCLGWFQGAIFFPFISPFTANFIKSSFSRHLRHTRDLHTKIQLPSRTSKESFLPFPFFVLSRINLLKSLIFSFRFSPVGVSKNSVEKFDRNFKLLVALVCEGRQGRFFSVCFLPFSLLAPSR